MDSMRLDVLLVERGLFPSRERAKAAVASGAVYVDGEVAAKPGMSVRNDCEVEIRGQTLEYVSRGGLKLEKAIEVFGLGILGVVAADIGASTGGFTDCMLRRGAAKVYAIDVGQGQLAESLRNDARVVNMERTNIRDVTPEMLEPLDFATIDVSFISLELVLPCVQRLLKHSARVVALIKPQFEAGRTQVCKKGVVRDAGVHKDVLDAFIRYSVAAGFSVERLDFSPVKGPEGNIEYLALLVNEQRRSPEHDTRALVAASHKAFEGSGKNA